MKIRRLGIVAVCVLVGVVPLLVAEPAGAATRQARGQASCNLSGKLVFSPALTNTPQSVRATIKGKLSCPLVSTSSTSVVSGGTVAISSSTYTATCAAPVPPSLSGSVRWKSASGGKVIPSGFGFGAPTSSAARPVRYQNGWISGSYGGGIGDARLDWPTGCGPKGLKRTSAGGTLLLSHCVRNVNTRIQPAQTMDGYVWWVVLAPDCGYGQADHPTGTISWVSTNPSDIPACTARDVPLQRVWPTEQYWGARTEINLGALEGCYGPYSEFRYSGDARYRPANG